MLVLSSMSPARGCNRYGSMDPHRHARPSTKQRSQIRILESSGLVAAPSRTQESVQQKTARNNSPPQNEQGGGGEVSFIIGSRSSREQRVESITSSNNRNPRLRVPDFADSNS